MKFIIPFIVAAMLFSCEEPAAKTDVYQIRNIGLLATTEYTIGKVIKLEDNTSWYKFGDRNILISCKAKIKAGVDLGKLSEKDITVKGDAITINLPAPEILSLDMDPNQVQTEMVDVNGFRQQFSQEDKNRILIQGEKSIRANITNTNILPTAEKNADIFVQDFYHQLGFKTVVVNFNKSYVPEIKIR